MLGLSHDQKSHFKLSNLVFAPQQVVGLIVDAGADKVQAVVLDSEIEISKPEDQSGLREGTEEEGGRMENECVT